MEIVEVTPFSLQLPSDSPVWRIPPRPNHLRDIAYQFDFDYHTVFYDVFLSDAGSSAVCIGPPLLNLESYIENSTFGAIGLSQRMVICKKIIDSLPKCLRM